MVQTLTLGLGDGWAEGAEAGPETLIRQGIELRRTGDNARAHGYLKRAYEMAQTPRSAAQLGLVEQALGQFQEAELHLSEGLASKDAWIQTNRAGLESSRAFVRNHLGRVTLVGAPTDATVAIGSDPAFKLPRDQVVWIAPGKSTLVIRSTPDNGITKTVTLKAGESVALAVDLAPPAPVLAAAPLVPPAADVTADSESIPAGRQDSQATSTPPSREPAAVGDDQASRRGTLRTTGVVLAITGAALCVTGFVLRGLSSSKLTAIESDASLGRPYNESNGNWKTFEGVGVGLLAAGGAGIVAGTVLYLLNRSPATDGRVSVSFVRSSGGNLLQVSGSY